MEGEREGQRGGGVRKRKGGGSWWGGEREEEEKENKTECLTILQLFIDTDPAKHFKDRK